MTKYCDIVDLMPTVDDKRITEKYMAMCGDNRFEIINKAKEALLESTNISTSADEMACLDSFLFRCWQMGWLKQYERGEYQYVCAGDGWTDLSHITHDFTHNDGFCDKGERGAECPNCGAKVED